MPKITDPANPNYDFGTDFSYENWTADTVLTLCNVPWNNDYRDIVKFPSKNALNAYIDGLGNANATIENARYAPVNVPVRIDMKFNAAYRFNYLRATNGDGRDFYYFITDVRYVAADTTEIVVQLDLWQTFGFDVTFGRCYIEQGHIGIANEHRFHNYGRTYLTIPEGLDVGNEYETVAHRRETVMNGVYPYDPGYDGGHITPNILVLSSVDFFEDAGTVDNPKLKMARPTGYGAGSFGLKAYIFEHESGFSNFITSMRDKPWVLEGIHSVTMIPNVKRYHPDATFADVQLEWYPDITVPVSMLESWGTFGTQPEFPKRRAHNMYVNWREAMRNALPPRYRHLDKFLTYPYMIVEATTWSGSALILKPEAWNNPDARMVERANLIPPSQRVTFTAYGYNSRSPENTDFNGDDGGDFLDMAINIDSFPSIPIMNDAGILSLAQRAHGLAFEFQTADWSQTRAMEGARVAYGQASSGIGLANMQTELQNRLRSSTTAYNNQINGIQTGVGMLGSVGAGAVAGAPGGVPGALAGAGGAVASMPFTAANAAIEARRAEMNTQATNQVASYSQERSAAHSGYVRDTNRDLAEFGAQGDYRNTIAGINARVQDAALTQPSLRGQFGGDIIDVNYGTSELSLRWKVINGAALTAIGEYWLRYGYAVRQFGTLPASLMVMSNFTYWKLAETYIRSAPMPESFKQAIRGIFEKGVTVWSDPAKIGTIDVADNDIRSGVTL